MCSITSPMSERTGWRLKDRCRGELGGRQGTSPLGLVPSYNIVIIISYMIL